MAWRVDEGAVAPQVKIYVGEELVETLTNPTATDVKNKVMEIMRERGIYNADVYVNGTPTTPETFTAEVQTAIASGDEVIVRIIKVEKAA